MSVDIYKEIVSLRARGTRAALAIIIAHEGAAPRKDAVKMLIGEDGRQIGNVGGGLVEADVARQAKEVMNTGKPRLLSYDLSGIDHDERALVCGGSMQIYIDPVLPDPELVVFGAGHVAKAVAEAAAAAGFSVTVFDDRAKYATAERFPGAKVVLVEDSENWDEALNGLNLTSSSYVFVATQRPRTDRICLRRALMSPARYIGMLGSLTKTKILLEALRKEGVDPARFSRIFIPAGLDIGSETPEEIAASVIPELIAARKNLDVGRLRDAVRAAKSFCKNAD
ncbi:MAG: XdhC/CoxI family protein [Acidobacteriota bacterium]|jgi:xanthine dehydrogenase accessory factor|nr:XdhC/CoxI family protein [Acidobacteriota bacterium]